MSDEDQKFGLAGNEAAQGYEPMPMALPVEPTTALDVAEDLGTDDPAYRHLTRPDEGEPVDRSYHDINTGKEIPPNQTVSAEQASFDLQRTRDIERQAREDLAAQDLRSALDQTEQPQQTAQDQQPAALDEIQPEAIDADAARAHAEAAWAEADAAISKMLEDPHVRERVEGEFNAVRQEANAHVEQARQQAEQVKQAFAQHAAALAAESNAVLLAQFPELAGAQNGEQLRGALAALQQTNPQRAAAFVQLATKAQQIAMVQHQQQQQQVAQQQQRQQQEFQRYAAEQMPGPSPTRPRAAHSNQKLHLRGCGQGRDFARSNRADMEATNFDTHTSANCRPTGSGTVWLRTA